MLPGEDKFHSHCTKCVNNHEELKLEGARWTH